MPLRLPDPARIAPLLRPALLPANSLVRLSCSPATEPWWSHGRYRFDGPPPSEPGSFGTCYAAAGRRLDVAFAESVIHESAWFDGAQWVVPLADLTGRWVVPLQRPAKPQLQLADLTGGALKALGLNNDLSAGDDYTLPMAWARAIHAAGPQWDGLLYVSRQHNDGLAVALFERSGVTRGRVTRLAGAKLDALCEGFGVVAV